MVDYVADVLDPLRRVLDEARFATAGTLEAGVKRNDDESLIGQSSPVDVAGGLLLATTDRMHTDDRRICG